MPGNFFTHVVDVHNVYGVRCTNNVNAIMGKIKENLHVSHKFAFNLFYFFWHEFGPFIELQMIRLLKQKVLCTLE